MSTKTFLKRSKVVRGKDQDAHFYEQNGTPRYDVPNIRQARKLNLLASPTTKLGVVGENTLTNWKTTSGMDCVISTPRRIPMILPTGTRNTWDIPLQGSARGFDIVAAGERLAGPFDSYESAVSGLECLHRENPALWETEEAWIKRIADEFEKVITKGSRFGTSFHEPMERLARGLPHEVPATAHIHPWIVAGERWLRANIVKIYEVEAVMINYENRTAGKTDLLAEHRVLGPVFVDWKSQDVKHHDRVTRRPKPVFYDKWAAQLGFYRSGTIANPTTPLPHGLRLSDFKCMNVVFDSNAPSDGVEHVWKESELEHAAVKFDLCAKYYAADRKYFPAIDEAARAKVMSRQLSSAPSLARTSKAAVETDLLVSAPALAPALFSPRASSHAGDESPPDESPPSDDGFSDLPLDGVLSRLRPMALT